MIHLPLPFGKRAHTPRGFGGRTVAHRLLKVLCEKPMKPLLYSTYYDTMLRDREPQHPWVMPFRGPTGQTFEDKYVLNQFIIGPPPLEVSTDLIT